MRTSGLFEDTFYDSRLAILSEEHHSHSMPVSVLFDDNWAEGNGVFFEPIPGFHFGLCGPLTVLRDKASAFYWEEPALTCYIQLSGESLYLFDDPANTRIPFRENMAMLSLWSRTGGSILLPAQKNYSHVGMSIQETAGKTFFGEATYNQIKQSLAANAPGGEGCVRAVTGLVTPDCLLAAKNLFSIPLQASLGDMFLRCAVLDLFSKIIHCIMQRPSAKQLPLMEYEIKRFGELKKKIEKEFLLIESIDYLCFDVGMNKAKVQQGFKQLYGVTPSKFIHNCKMNFAHGLLEDRKMNVSQCAVEIGYSNISHFISAYKKIFGLTPKQTLMKNMQ